MSLLFFEQQNEQNEEFKCVAANKLFNEIVNYAVIRLIKWHFNVSKCSYGPTALENRKKSASLLVKILSKKPVITY